MLEYSVGDTIKGKVTGIEDYGIFLSISQDISGLIHISEISNSFVRNVNDYAKIGDELTAKVIEYDKVSKKMKLSIKDFVDEVKQEKQKIIETKSGFSNLGNDLYNWIEIKEKEIMKKNKKNSK